jgi:hypothetical protein
MSVLVRAKDYEYSYCGSVYAHTVFKSEESQRGYEGMLIFALKPAFERFRDKRKSESKKVLSHE